MYWTQGLHRSLQQTPDAPATIFGERTRSFREQAERVARLAGALRELGVRDGERVGVLARNSDRYAELLLAVPWANGVVNPIDVRCSAGEVAQRLDDTGTGIVFADDAGEAVATALEGRTVVYDEGYEDLLSRADPVEDARRGGDALAGLFYTGGTSGTSKAVMLSHAGLLTGALAVLATVPSLSARGGRTLLAGPMGHLSGVLGWLLQSVSGGAHVIAPAFEPAAVLDLIERYRVTHVFLVPAMLQRVVDHPAITDHDLSSVCSLLYGASPITEALLARAMRTFPAAELAQVYALTELAATGTFLTPQDHREGRRLSSAGRPVLNLDVGVVDAEGNEVPRGAVGEVVCRTDCVMLGYWGRPDETAEALRGGWMHTGDAGYLDDDGYLYIVDRLKDLIKVGGSSLYSSQVENAIGSHPAVAGCAVIGVPDGADERVHAVVVLRPGRAARAADLAEHCRRLIAGYKVPTSWEFADALPLSTAGKVLKRELRVRCT